MKNIKNYKLIILQNNSQNFKVNYVVKKIISCEKFIDAKKLSCEKFIDAKKFLPKLL